MRSAGKPAEIAVDHSRTISTLRLVKKVDALAVADAARLRELIVEMYGLPYITGKIAWISSLHAASTQHRARSRRSAARPRLAQICFESASSFFA